jgi:hypothetical protein
MSYLKTPAQLEEPFDTSNIPKISREQAAAEVPVGEGATMSRATGPVQGETD